MYHIQNNGVDHFTEAIMGSSDDWDFQDQTGLKLTELKMTLNS